MKKNLFKFAVGGMVVVFVLLIVAILNYEFHPNVPNIGSDHSDNDSDVSGRPMDVSGRLEVYFLDVGQGDAIYIRTPDEVDVLIDGGPDKNVLNQLGQVMPFYDKEIDVMILTHPHADHVTGLVEVLRRFKVKQIYYTGVLHTAPDYLLWLEEIKKQEIPLYIVSDYSKLDLGELVDLEFLYPLEDFTNKKVENLNNTSIVNKLSYGETSFLLTGDAEVEVEEFLLRDIQDLSTDSTRLQDYLEADVLKAGHHGSSTASSEEFLGGVDPDFVVIQSGVDNQFGHPHARTLNRLERMEIPVYRNDQMGTISLFSDGMIIGIQ